MYNYKSIVAKSQSQCERKGADIVFELHRFEPFKFAHYKYEPSKLEPNRLEPITNPNFR